MKIEFRQSGDDGTVDIYLYDDVVSNRWLYESDTSAKHFKKLLFEDHKDAQVINLYINSMGGDVVEGTAIANMLRRHPAQTIAHIDGFACSVASVIAVACDKVVMPKNTMMLIHNMWTWATGNANELRAVADDLDKMMVSNRTIYLDKAGDRLTEEQLIAMLSDETWLTADECVAYGFCDEIVDAVEMKEQSVAVLENENQRIAMLLEQQEALKVQLAGAKQKSEDPEQANEDEPQTADKGGFLMQFFKKERSINE